MALDTNDYDQARQVTALSLNQTTDQLTYLPLPEREALIEEVSRVVPAGNVPGLIAAALAHLPERAIPAHLNRRNMALLMQGMQTFLDRAVFRTFFAGPAAVLAAYQMILRLAGKDLDQSFPEGTWQFYVEFGLREDTSRHACETLGFQQALENERLNLNPADRLAAWVSAAGWLLRIYPDLLAQEFTERVQLRHLAQHIDQPRLGDDWLKKRPYHAPRDGGKEYLDHRREVYEGFVQNLLARLNPRLRRQIETSWKQGAEQRARDLTAYQRQMSILACLTPSDHSDSRNPLQPEQWHIGVIAAKRYFLLDSITLSSLDHTRQMCAVLLARKNDERPTATLDRTLVTTPRREQSTLRRLLPPETLTELELLRTAPILINWDVSKAMLLSDIRQGQRGIGDHALTVFQTPQSTVFDLSHIFFDGPNGMATAEILTGQAIRVARQIARDPHHITIGTLRIKTLVLQTPSNVTAQARKSPPIAETSAESNRARLDLIQEVRRILYRRNAALRLTVNDFLVLYRAVFGPLYFPAPTLLRALADLSAETDPKVRNAAQLAMSALDAARAPNPALLIPIDATSISPRERIYPTTVRNPISNLIDQHKRTLEALWAMEARNPRHPPAETAIVLRDRRGEYLASLQAFSERMANYKNVSLQGESISTATIKLLAGLPPSLQRLLDSLPGRFDVVNDVVKGQEVFSNVGQVSSASSLARFNTAKDDNEKKTLAWGVLTDAQGVMHLSLRDFRPHVAALMGIRQRTLAQHMAQDYLDKYVIGLNAYLDELLLILRARSSSE